MATNTTGETDKSLKRTNFNEVQLLQEVIRRFIRGFSSGLCLHAGYALLRSLLKNSLKDGLLKTWKTVCSKQCFQTALFFGCLPSIYRPALALLKKSREKEDGWNYSIAGALAGLSIVCVDKEQRKTFTFLFLSRALGAGLSILVARGDIAHVPHTDVLVFAACCGLVLYSTCVRPDYMSPSYYYSILKWAKDYSDSTATYVFRNPGPKFLTCQEGGVHQSSCLKHAVVDLTRSFPAFMKIYAPIHAIPVLFYKRQMLKNNPESVIKSYIKNVSTSASFLVVMVGVAKLFLCLLRNYTHLPPPLPGYIPLVSGFLAGGLSLLCERKSRRKELALFTFFQTLSIIHTAFKKSSLPLSDVTIPRGFTLTFSLSMMIVMYAYEKHPSSLNSAINGVLKFFAGKRESDSTDEKQKQN